MDAYQKMLEKHNADLTENEKGELGDEIRRVSESLRGQSIFIQILFKRLMRMYRKYFNIAAQFALFPKLTLLHGPYKKMIDVGFHIQATIKVLEANKIEIPKAFIEVDFKTPILEYEKTLEEYYTRFLK